MTLINTSRRYWLNHEDVKRFYKGDYQHHGRPIPDTEENRRIKEWDAQTALAKLEEEIWFKKL